MNSLGVMIEKKGSPLLEYKTALTATPLHILGVIVQIPLFILETQIWVVTSTIFFFEPLQLTSTYYWNTRISKQIDVLDCVSS
jgi:hypothetical protein